MITCQGCAKGTQDVKPINVGYYIAPEDETPIDGIVHPPGTRVPIVLELCPECRNKDQYVQEPFKRGIVKVGRNEPCPCGSGKKFKKCCS